MDAILRQCARSYLDSYYRIRIRDISYEIDGETTAYAAPGSKRMAFLVKTLSMPSPDEVPLLHALGLVADEAYRRGVSVEIYEYEPLTSPVDRFREVKRLSKWLLSRDEPLLIVVPSVLQVALLDIIEEAGGLHPIGTFRVVRDLYFYLPRTPLGGVRFLVKTNSRASFKKYQLMRRLALSLGLRVWKEKLFNSNREILDFLVKEAMSSGPRGLAVNVPVTRLSLAAMAVLKCTGDDDLIGEQNIEAGEEEEFVFVSYRMPIWMRDVLEESFRLVADAYQLSNAYPRDEPRASLVGRLREHMSSNAVSEVKRLYEALSMYKSS